MPRAHLWDAHIWERLALAVALLTAAAAVYLVFGWHPPRRDSHHRPDPPRHEFLVP